VNTAPSWFAAGGAAMMVVVVLLWGRRFSRLWRKMREHPEKMGDDWDPFE
jgi:hypothetical protein